jgi:hypothetical protein
METSKETQLPPPPGVVGALRAGLDITSNHLSVLLLPLALDLLLWFGPRLSVKSVFLPAIEEMIKINSSSGLPVDGLTILQTASTDFLGQFNLFSALRTFPIGVSSLMTDKMPVQTPLGGQATIEVGSVGTFILLAFGLTILGWILGGLYFNSVSRVTGNGAASLGMFRTVAQTLLFSTGLAILSMMIGFPVLIVLIVLELISPALMQVVLVLFALVATWLIVPVYFSPFGIYLRGENALTSTWSGLRLARFTLPTSSIFVLAIFIISYGLNFLWEVPAENSWMMLVGVIGHAFIATALLASSFIYYRDMNAWLQIALERMKPNTAASQM